MEKIIAQFKALPTWQKYTLILGLPLILIVYIWLMLISSTSEEVSKLRIDLQNTKSEIDSIRASMNLGIIENLKKEKKRLEEEYIKKERELLSLVGQIPTQKEIGLIIRNIGKIAQKSGLIVINMQISSPQKVNYVLFQDGEKKFVKEIQGGQQSQDQQQQQQQQQAQPASQQEGVSFLRSELRVTLLGSYDSLRNFLKSLKLEGITSYPLSLNLTPEGNILKTELVIYIIMKEEPEL